MSEKFFLCLLGISVGLTISASAYAETLQIQTGRITVNRSREGDIYINTGRTQIDSSLGRSHLDPFSLPYYRSNPRPEISPYPNQCIRQDTRQISRSGRIVHQTSTSHHYCR